MNIKQSTLATAVTAALAMGVAGQANAYVYSVANLSINNLILDFGPGAVQPVVNRFDFSLTNTATLNGVTSASSAACGGTPGPGNNNCTPGLGSMDAAVVNAIGSTSLRTENATSSLGNEFTMYGPATGGNWSNSDSQIISAELVNLGNPTVTRNIAESEITTATGAAASSQIQSITGFTINFTLAEVTTLDLSFIADPELYAGISGQPPGSYSASAALSAIFTLTNAATNAVVNWSPNGVVAANGCAVFGGPTCTENQDSQNLNRNVGTTINGTNESYSYDPNALNQTAFGISVANLTAGDWSLTLKETKSTQLAFTPVPEPGSLALLGIGLAGLGAVGRRRKLS